MIFIGVQYLCHICKKELLTDKVRDHCHFTGQYRGAAHNSCNLQCKKTIDSSSHIS